MCSNTIYVRIYVNKFIVKSIENNEEVIDNATKAFTTTRLLVGNFLMAESILTKAIKTVGNSSWFSAKPIIVMHPMAMVDGVLSEVEDRVLRELAASAGARKILIWVGKQLTDEEITNKVKNI